MAEKMYEKILVPLDGSEVAESIIPFVEKSATAHNSTIVLLRVVQIHTLPGQTDIEGESAAIRDAEEYLSRIEEDLKKKGFDVESHVRYGKDAEEIINFCDEPGIDIIAMSTHGRTGLGKWLLGSVAERIVRHCPIPTLLYRPKK
jgi:nucleotide-binding universal stress UspA family protein